MPRSLPALETLLILLTPGLLTAVQNIGGFIAWSWDEIQSFDTGNGVTLTATWLLPIALIPGTWEDDDVPSTPSSTTTPSTSAIKAPTGQGTGTTTQSANATTV